MATDDPPPGRQRDPGEETQFQRLNRQLDQLLSELRVALPGVQVLLGFLLTVPFTERFDTVTGSASAVYIASITLTALASILFTAPVLHHRLRFQDGVKAELIRAGNRLALAGATCLGLAIGCAVYVAGDTGFPDTPARWIGPGLVLAAALVWFALPLRFVPGRHHRH